MKKNSYIALLFCILLGVSACYNEEGNYDYTEIQEIGISGIAESYTRIALQDTLRITPEVSIENNNEPFTYLWTIRSVSAANTDMGDTIGKDKALVYPVNLKQGIYDIALQVTDYRNLEKIFRTQLLVETQFSRGFFVLKETENHTELDLHLPDQNVISNLLEKSSGHVMEGKPNSLGFKYDYYYINPETAAYELTNILTVCTEKDALILKAEDMSVIYNHETMFVGEIPADEPLYIFCHPQGLGYISNEGYYQSYQLPPYSKGSGRFGIPLAIEENCQPDIHTVINGTTKTVYFYDRLNQRLLCDSWAYLYSFEETGYHGSQPSPNHIPYQLKYLGRNEEGGISRGYAVFKEQTGKHYIYELDFDLMKYYDSSNPIISVKEVPSTSEFNAASHYAINERGAKFIYFTANAKLYLYDIELNTSRPLSFDGLPADEEITYLSNRFWTQEDDAENNFNYLAIGTHKNGNYKIYLYNMLGGTPQGQPRQILKGQGKAVMMQYMSPKMVGNSYLNYPGSL